MVVEVEVEVEGEMESENAKGPTGGREPPAAVQITIQILIYSLSTLLLSIPGRSTRPIIRELVSL